MIRTTAAAAWLAAVALACACGRSEPVAVPPPADAPAVAPADAAAADVAATPAATDGSAATAAVGTPGDSALVLPGEFAESTTLGDLQARFGPHAVLVEEAVQDDGSVRRRVVLFPDEPARRAYVEFHDPEAMAGIASIVVRDAGSVWRGKEGVRVGMSFAELRAANGRPFHFSGFDPEGRAWVRDGWSVDDGEATGLGALDVGPEDRMYFGVDLGLRGGPGAVPDDAWPHDEPASSDDPRWPRLGTIAEVTAIVASTSLDDEWE